MAFCDNDWREFKLEAPSVRFRWLKYWSLSGFLTFVVAVVVMPYVGNEWVLAIGTAGGLIWSVFGAAYRRVKFQSPLEVRREVF